MSDRTCSTCRYWSPEVVDDARTGSPAPVMVCKRYPPALAPWQDELVAQQPQTGPDDWCGEHVWAKPRTLAEVPVPVTPRTLVAHAHALEAAVDHLTTLAGISVQDPTEDPVP